MKVPYHELHLLCILSRYRSNGLRELRLIKLNPAFKIMGDFMQGPNKYQIFQLLKSKHYL